MRGEIREMTNLCLCRHGRVPQRRQGAVLQGTQENVETSQKTTH